LIKTIARAIVRLMPEGLKSSLAAELYARTYYQLGSVQTATPSKAGVLITRDTALECAAVYAAVKIIAEDVGSLPFMLFRRRNGVTQRAEDHPLWQVLHDMPNPDMSAGEFIEAMTAQALLGLDGHALIERSSDGRVVALWPIEPERVYVERDNAGRLRYHVRAGATTKVYGSDHVFVLRGFTLTGDRGDRVLERARQVIGLALASQEYASRYFEADATPGVILQRPLGAPPLGPEAVERLKQQFVQWHAGLRHAHEPAVLQEGTELKRISPGLAESQLIEQRQFQVLEICRIFRLPPHKLAELTRATHTNIEQENIAYVSHTLAPWLRRWRQAVHRCLLTPEERATRELYAEHQVEAFLRGDFRTQAEGWARLLQAGVYSINEVRRWLNLNPIEGGDAHFIQLNLQDVLLAAVTRDEKQRGPAAFLVGGELDAGYSASYD
jgi:HK97 family phage portal protein